MVPAMRRLTWFLVPFLALGCSRKNVSPPPADPSDPSEPAGPVAPPVETVQKVPETPPAPPPKPEPVRVSEGFATPESILHDDAADVYLVSNINGVPLGKDDNGFISRVDPEGKIVELKWIDGASKKVKLNAPKGMAFVGEVLYVADIDTVRMFDRKTGAPRGEVKIPKATFLNDVVAQGDTVYVSDSGLDASFKPTGTDAIWSINGKKAKALIKSKELGAPNGLALKGEELWVSTFGSGEVYRVADGKREDISKPPGGQLDGLVFLPDGTMLVSSWEKSTVYGGNEPRISDVASPADFGYDAKRNRVLIPLFTKNSIELHQL